MSDGDLTEMIGISFWRNNSKTVLIEILKTAKNSTGDIIGGIAMFTSLFIYVDGFLATITEYSSELLLRFVVLLS